MIFVNLFGAFDVRKADQPLKLAFDEWASVQRERLRLMALEVLPQRIVYLESRGEFGRMQQTAGRYLEMEL